MISAKLMALLSATTGLYPRALIFPTCSIKKSGSKSLNALLPLFQLPLAYSSFDNACMNRFQ